MEQSFHSLTIFVALGCQVETPPSHFGGRPAHEDIADVENYIPDHWFKPAFIGSLSRVAVGEYLKNRDRLALQGPKSRCPGMGWTGRAPALRASMLVWGSRRSTMPCRSLTPPSSLLVSIPARIRCI